MFQDDTNNPALGTANTVTTLAGWLKQPFTTTMNAGHWTLFVGLIMCACILWGFILHEIKGEI